MAGPISRSRVPTEDFNAARVVFDICVQKIGTKWRGPNG
jgi:hypothetical protein